LEEKKEKPSPNRRGGDFKQTSRKSHLSWEHKGNRNQQPKGWKCEQTPLLQAKQVGQKTKFTGQGENALKLRHIPPNTQNHGKNVRGGREDKMVHGRGLEHRKKKKTGCPEVHGGNSSKPTRKETTKKGPGGKDQRQDHKESLGEPKMTGRNLP